MIPWSSRNLRPTLGLRLNSAALCNKICFLDLVSAACSAVGPSYVSEARVSENVLHTRRSLVNSRWVLLGRRLPEQPCD